MELLGLTDLTVNEQILVMRSREGISETELANRLGYARPYFCRKMAADNLTVNDLKKIAEIFGYELKVDFKKTEE